MTIFNQNKKSIESDPFGLISLSPLIYLWLLCLLLLTACTARDSDLENALSAKLQQFKNSNAPSMDLREVLGKNWRKVCVQSPYEYEERFSKDSGEKINRLLDISENEFALWVFYDDGSVRAAIFDKVKMDILYFGVPISKEGKPIICASPKYPHIYAGGQTGRTIFYFNGHRTYALTDKQRICHRKQI